MICFRWNGYSSKWNNCHEIFYLPFYWILPLKERMCAQAKQIYSLKMTPVILKVSDVWRQLSVWKLFSFIKQRQHFSGVSIHLNTYSTRQIQQMTNWWCFSHFSQKLGFDILCKLFFFLGKIRKNSKCHLLKFLHSILSCQNSCFSLAWDKRG